MKSFDFVIDKAFIAGQHTENIPARNRDVLTKTKNMRPTEFGLAFNTPIAEPLTSPPAVNWPYPQLFKGRFITILADDQAIYRVNESNGVLTELKTYSLASVKAPSTNIVTNGTFASTTGWTLGTGWSVSGGKLVGTGVTGGASASHVNAVAGKRYRVTFTLDSTTAGSVFMNIGGKFTEYVSTPGVHVIDVEAASSTAVEFKSTDGFSGVIDNLSVVEVELATIPAGGGGWHFADFGKNWFMFKEGCMLARVPYFTNYGVVCITLSDDDFQCLTGDNAGNRLFLGGITAATLLGTDNWTDAWNAWIENSSEWSDEMTTEDMVLTDSTIFYSTRVGGDIYWPFIAEMALLGMEYRDDADIIAELKANYIDWIRKGEMGFVPLQHQGAVLRVKRLGDGIVAYCEDGVSVVSPREGRGFSTTPVLHVGIAGRCAVAGDHNRHVFIDKNNVQWGLNVDGSLERLCGTGTFDSLVANEAAHPIMGSYDPEEMEYYLCSDQSGWVRTRTGLGEITKLPTSLVLMGGELASGGVQDLADGDIDIVTETFDMGMRALKTLHTIHVGYSDITNLKVYVQYRYNSNSAWTTSSAFSVTSDNVSVPIFTAHEFRLKFTGTPGASAKLDYVAVNYQVSDKRNIRSQYGSAY